MDSMNRSLYRREIGGLGTHPKTYRKLYSDRRLMNELDIVNELDGHSGCVNALSWSKSGGLLASGSDDQHLNIHTYQPQSSTAQFRLTTTVATGHSANIFSVKFMPHSNDRTVITAAGDAQVRIFDLEYSGQTKSASSAASLATEGRRRTRSIYNDVRYLSDGDTYCRVYRSHGDRVKRIVTESSPYLFLTCSEDGEVRQWDLRQPSSFYPPPRGGRLSSTPDGSVPPPLISYKRYNLDLNTISCSASQPHYIALGGAHLHAFLHDRRMTGRDRLREAGKPLPSVEQMTAREEELMNQATQCVRKFAPTGQRKMKRIDNGHITACKISDARPNEMIVSWSGEHIYSFDLVHSPGADEEDTLSPLHQSGRRESKQSRDRKRKRQGNESETSLSQIGAARQSSRPRTQAASSMEDAALRVRYQNGQSEDIPVSIIRGGQRRWGLSLTERQRKAQHMAESAIKIRHSLFDRNGEENIDTFQNALDQAASLLPEMDDTIRDWRYPMDPPEETVVAEQALRRDRESVRRFVQAAGAISRMLCGGLQPLSSSSSNIVSFLGIESKSNEQLLPRGEHFAYDFVKAIMLWLESGIGRLIEGFTRPMAMSPSTKSAQRLPIPESDATTEAVEEILIPYLLNLSSDKPVINVKVNHFEVDENMQLFPSEKSAVHAFAAAVKIPFADLSSAAIIAEGADYIQAQDRQTAFRYWGFKVARGILLNAADGISTSFVRVAFGGLLHPFLEPETDRDVDLASDADDAPIDVLEILDQNGNEVDGATADDVAAAFREVHSMSASEEPTESTALLAEEADRSPSEILESTDARGVQDNDNDGDEDDDVHDTDGDDSSSENDDSDESSDPDEEDGVPNLGIPRQMYASAFERRRMKEKVEADVPCSAYSRVYRGHCNVKTVKDVNYFGLDDEYVVSGSDDGNFFIWDQRSGELINVLEGDGEVVNVVQGHPYETMLAVSGIDHTIKIFSPDGRAREAARMGTQGIAAHDASAFSSLSWPSRIGRRRVPRRNEHETAQPDAVTSEPAVPHQAVSAMEVEVDEENDDHVGPNGLRSRKQMPDQYRITSQNEAERQGGNQDAFLTRSLLAQLARRMRAHRTTVGQMATVGQTESADETEDGDPTVLRVGDDCMMQIQ